MEWIDEQRDCGGLFGCYCERENYDREYGYADDYRFAHRAQTQSPLSDIL